MNNELYNLTNPQKSIWLTEQFYKGSSVNNICGTVLIDEIVDFKKLCQAINIFIKDNDSFRIHILIDDENNVKQYFSEFHEYNFQIHNLKDMDSLIELETSMATTPFSILENDLFDFEPFSFPNGKGGFVIVANHLISDACTAGLLASKIINIYTSLIKNTVPCESTTSYINYINSEEEYLSCEKFDKDKAYWHSKFNDVPEIASIPYSNSSNNTSCSALRQSFTLDNNFVSQINTYCRQNKISIFNFLMAIYSIYIGKVSGLDNFVLGTPILNRTSFLEKNTPGMFISTVPFAFSLNSNEKFINYVQNISLDSMGMFRHQKYPYQNILEHIRTKNPSQPNLYDILISYQNTRTNRNSSQIPYEVRWTFSNSTADSLDINIYDMNDTGMLSVAYDYQLAKYCSEDIIALHNRIVQIITTVINNSDVLIKDIEIITKQEKSYIFNDFNNSAYEYDSSLTLIDLFESQTKLTPDNIAVIYDDKQYTYSQLNNLVNYISSLINKKELYNQKIAVLAKKSLKTVATFLAIMKTGNCYIPIDPTYPEDRINYILENSNCDLLICDAEFSSLYNNNMVIDNFGFSNNYSFESLAEPDKLAYIIYTSGSTGTPKGVQIKHKNIINTLIWRKTYYKFNGDINVLQIPSFSFDSSVEDIFTPLISGSTLVIPTFSKMDINKICEYINKYNINHFLVVPSLYKILLSEKSEYLKYFKFITIAGESFNENLVKEHFEKLPNVRLINEYGPTENSVCSTFYEFTPDNTNISIGKPINNCKCLVLNNNLDLMPPNIPGELYLSGPGLSDGYLNKPDLTAERFFTYEGLEFPIYKTGDIVKLVPPSGLTFMGRNDTQIKFHGFRIELQEISNVILKYKEVKDVVTIFKELPAPKKEIIISYLIVKNDFSRENLQHILKASLPYYMIPELVILETYPTTPNGKIDYKALPIDFTYNKTKHREPLTKLEKTVLEICRQTLSNDNLHIDDNLFTIGLADSLNILTITSKLYAQGIQIPTQQFYEALTIENICKNYTKKTLTSNLEIASPKFNTDLKNYQFNTIKFNYNTVLLTGSTGFLGIHLLSYLLINTNAKIKCIVRRKGNILPINRLRNLFIYYFDGKYLDLFDNRVDVIDGNLSYNNFALDKKTYASLKDCDSVIHAAALTKHYGDTHLFHESNVVATQNLIDFCIQNNIVLNYMSTTSISGNQLTTNHVQAVLTENDFYIGQNYSDNIYVNSKFEAEELIFKAQYNGLRANIFRLGNLMARSSDGFFQKNKYDNAFYMKLLVISKLQAIPSTMKDFPLDFSPIDDVACAITKIISISNLENCVFHITNPNVITMDNLKNILNNVGINIEYTSLSEFTTQLINSTNLMKYFVSDLSSLASLQTQETIKIDSNITNKFLNKLNFTWTTIDETYINQFFKNSNFLEDIKNI